MIRPRVKSKPHTLAMLHGEARCVYIMECGQCGNDIQVDAETEEEACNRFIEDGVRAVDTCDYTSCMMCSDCVDLARKNQLDA